MCVKEFLVPAALCVLLMAVLGPARGMAQLSPLTSPSPIYFPFWLVPEGWQPTLKGVGNTYNVDPTLVGARWHYGGTRSPDVAVQWSAFPGEWDGVESVPMTWAVRNMGQPVGGNSPYVLGPNECEFASQCNATPLEVAEAWALQETAYPDKRLVSPAVVNLEWLTQWWDASSALNGRPPRCNAVAFHCYAGWTWQEAANTCIARVGEAVSWAKERGIKEVWVTEFAYLPCWPDGVEGSILFMQAMIDYFESEPMVTRYAWFQMAYRGDEPWAFGGTCNTSLANVHTWELTPLGEAYRSY